MLLSKKIKKIILIGGNIYKQDIPINNCIAACKKFNLDILLISSNERINYPTKNQKNLKLYLKNKKIIFKVLENKNEKLYNFVNTVYNNNTIILSLNSRWIFKKKFLKTFKNSFNYHNADLPTQRGAACHSWRIMQNKFVTSLNIHKISQAVDKGEILISKKIKIPKYTINQNDYFKLLDKYEKDLFINFFKKVLGKKIKTIKQKNEKSFYWPALKNSKHGFIDWSWNTIEIINFCNAFDDPNKGGITFLNNKKIFLNKSKHIDKKVNFHSFQIGIIYRKINNKICVATKNGGIQFSLKKSDFNLCKIGKRLNTPLIKIYNSLEN